MGLVRAAIAVLLVIQLIVFELAVISRSRFTNATGGVALMLFLALVVYGAALSVVLKWWRPRSRLVLPTLIAIAIAFTLRFYVPLEMARRNRRDLASEMSPTLVTFLRELRAAQEQFRLRSGTYSDALPALSEWVKAPPGATVQIAIRGDSGWGAQASLDGRSCSMWVRDPRLRRRPDSPEGAPVCGAGHRGAHQLVRTVAGDTRSSTPFAPTDIFGTWQQHRVDVTHSATIASADIYPPVSWTTKLGGELRASVAVAGNQVFIGAHGNGLFAALHMKTGRPGFQIRVPNWIHHEPVVTEDLVIVTFGNSEAPLPEAPETGSHPSGIAAYDRATGVERWRRYAKGAMMTSPVLVDSTVTAVTNEFEAISWRASDGKELWRTRLPGSSAMGNPVVRDSLMVIGLEQTRLCVLNVHTGAILHCHAFAKSGWGAGHASPALDGDVVLQVYEGLSGVKTKLLIAARRMLGLPERIGDEVMVASRLDTGAELWRVALGTNTRAAVGHIAGTPVVVNGVAYVPSPNNGLIFAIRTDSGRVLWSTETNTARGSVLVARGAVLAASTDKKFFVLDAATGAIRCKQDLPAPPDRAGPTLAGETGILTLRNGMVMARPISDWLTCRA